MDEFRRKEKTAAISYTSRKPMKKLTERKHSNNCRT